MNPDAGGTQTRTILFGTLRGEAGGAGPARHLDAVAASVQAHGGRLHGNRAEAVLAVFHDSRSAIECATEIQRMHATGLLDPAAQRFAFGVHRGRVEIDEDVVRGAAVDVASRLEQLSDPGGVCISGEIRSELLGEMDLHTIDVGLREVESGGSPVVVHRLIIGRSLLQPDAVVSSFESRPTVALAATVLLLLGVTVAAGFWFANTPSESAYEAVASVAARPPAPSGVGALVRPTIVVVPFRADDPSVSDNVFAGGVSEALESELLVTAGVQVVVPPPHAGFGERSERNLEITRDLGARYALEGRVEREEEDAVLVVAELFDAQNGFRHFHAQYERSVGELPEVRREIRERVLAALEVDPQAGERR